MDAAHQTSIKTRRLQRHAAAHGPVSDCPLLVAPQVTLLPAGGDAMDAIFAAIAGR